jgi:dTDP-4-amino-4,6-dideoxygalactose transaminase
MGPPVDDETKTAVLAALHSCQYILGPECRALEQEFTSYIDSSHAVRTSRRTAALSADDGPGNRSACAS